MLVVEVTYQDLYGLCQVKLEPSYISMEELAKGATFRRLYA